MFWEKEKKNKYKKKGEKNSDSGTLLYDGSSSINYPQMTEYNETQRRITRIFR
jgi:hypothetical protein